MKQPHRRDRRAREAARRTRDAQWAFARRVARWGVVWVCWWDKYRRHREARSPDGAWLSWFNKWTVGPPDPNFESLCLFEGVELSRWLHSHPEWWIIGSWDHERCAAPVSLTDVGRAALAEWEKYDAERLVCGLVEPGWTVTPARRAGEAS